ncbi:MAG: hypothetical protein IJT87_07445 [Ruminiclostridium sp.]|nr:hypothetical protein [Ruminiclostridium sp.]
MGAISVLLALAGELVHIVLVTVPHFEALRYFSAWLRACVQSRKKK